MIRPRVFRRSDDSDYPRTWIAYGRDVRPFSRLWCNPAEPGAYDHEWLVVADDWIDGVRGYTPNKVLALLKRGMGGWAARPWLDDDHLLAGPVDRGVPGSITATLGGGKAGAQARRGTAPHW